MCHSRLSVTRQHELLMLFQVLYFLNRSPVLVYFDLHQSFSKTSVKKQVAENPNGNAAFSLFFFFFSRMSSVLVIFVDDNHLYYTGIFSWLETTQVCNKHVHRLD